MSAEDGATRNSPESTLPRFRKLKPQEVVVFGTGVAASLGSLMLTSVRPVEAAALAVAGCVTSGLSSWRIDKRDREAFATQQSVRSARDQQRGLAEKITVLINPANKKPVMSDDEIALMHPTGKRTTKPIALWIVSLKR